MISSVTYILRCPKIFLLPSLQRFTHVHPRKLPRQENGQRFFSQYSAFTLYGTSSQQDILTDGDVKELWENYGNSVSATVIQASAITEEPRYVGWCDIKTLSPNTTYYFASVFFNGQGDAIISEEHKVRTAPAGGSAYNFVTGGDISMDANGYKLFELAGKSNPLFAMVGGDIAYDSGFSTCYRRWDRWIIQWEKYMVTPTGFSIPMILAIGNHEAGGFLMSRNFMPFLTTYFPHQLGLANVPPFQRQTYHSHRIGNSTTILSLDSWVISTPADQTQWIQNQLFAAQQNKTLFTFAIYHAALYPSVPDWDPEIQEALRQAWEPTFSQYFLTAAFENHYHVYKRTYPILNGRVHPNGTVYLGDGSWGIVGSDIPAVADSWWMEKLEKVPFVYFVKVDPLSGLTVQAVGTDGVVFDTWTKTVD